MSRSILAASLALAFSCPAQTREAKPEPKDFPTLVKEADKAFTAKEFSKAIEQLKAALKLAREALRKAVLAVMPKAPQDFKVWVLPKKAVAAHSFASSSNMMALPIEQRYIGPNNKNLTIQCYFKTPMIRAAQGALRMAADSPNHEKIGYDAHQGVLEKQHGGKRLNLQIILHGKHLITVIANNMTDEELFKMINQAFVDAVAKILGE